MVEKSFESFNKCKKGRQGLHNHCRDCQKEIRHLWYLKHRQEQCKSASAYAKSQIGVKARHKRYKKNKDVLLAANRKYRSTPRARRLANIARNKRYHEDLSFRISVNYRTRIRKALRKHHKAQSTIALIGCTIEELKLHLESKFSEGMSWGNYGFYGWHIDHVIPCDSFDLSKPEEQTKCFHYSNLQPLWMHDNMSKHNKIR